MLWPDVTRESHPPYGCRYVCRTITGRISHWAQIDQMIDRIAAQDPMPCAMISAIAVPSFMTALSSGLQAVRSGDLPVGTGFFRPVKRGRLLEG